MPGSKEQMEMMEGLELLEAGREQMEAFASEFQSLQ